MVLRVSTRENNRTRWPEIARLVDMFNAPLSVVRTTTTGKGVKVTEVINFEKGFNVTVHRIEETKDEPVAAVQPGLAEKREEEERA